MSFNHPMTNPLSVEKLNVSKDNITQNWSL